MWSFYETGRLVSGRLHRGSGMTNQSAREPYHLPEKKAAIASQMIAAAIEG